MTRLLLKINAFLSRRKALAWAVLALAICASAFLVTRVSYSEDISAFLPQNEESARYSSVYERLGGSKVAVLFRPGESLQENASPGEIRDMQIAAMDRFAELWEEADTAALVSGMQAGMDADLISGIADFIRMNAPYLLEEQDYRRIDSLLAVPGYISSRMEKDMQMLMFPSSAFVSRSLRYDPLDFFSPIFARMLPLSQAASGEIADSHIFLDSGQVGAVFFNSPFGGSETGQNAVLVGLLSEVTDSLAEEFPDIKVSSSGGPVIAVTNASQIKKDSIIAVLLAVILIAVVLFLSFRDLGDILWIGFSILCGSLFALALMSLLKDSVSVIVLGIGSVIIGIAVNYPLHYIDHLKHEPDTGKALKDIVNPLLVGNITTVCAFLSLFMLRAEALHDFGLTGALMLVGTILFVLLFLPCLMRSGKKRSEKTVNFDFARLMPEGIRKKAAVPFAVATCVLAFFSSRTAFDPDMRNINYMTDGQREDLALLSSAASSHVIYAVSCGSGLDEALEANERLTAALSPVLDGSGVSVGSISAIVPSSGRQRENLAAWESFAASHPGLADELCKAARAAGFADGAFNPFVGMLSASHEVLPAEHFSPLLESVGRACVLYGDDGIEIVNYVSVPEGQEPVRTAESLKESMKEAVPAGSGSFVFDSQDVGNRLVALLSEDFDSIGLVCSLIVFVFLWISFRRVELSLLSFLPLAVSWIWILGIMQIFGIKFNIVNIILATFIFGQGDDYTIFMTEGLMYEYAYGKKILSSYRNSVALSAIIMFIGIGTLIFARHPAMRSLAYVTIIGMLTVVTTAWFLPPAVFGWMTGTEGHRREMPLTLKRLARTALALLAFMLSMLVVTPASWLYFTVGKDTRERRLRYHRFLQRLSRIAVTHIPGVRFSVTNLSGEDFSRPAVIIANHQSHLDILCLLMLSPRIVVLTNDWVWKSYRGIIRHAEFYPVSNGMEKNLELLAPLAAAGYSVLVFPEGTRSEDCSIGRFHRGAFYIAEQLGLDILPVFIHGAGHVLPKNELMLRKGSIHVEIHGRTRPGDISMGDGYRGRTRGFRNYFAVQYARICSERENAEYWSDLVRHQYVYKGASVEKECRSQLSCPHVGMIGSYTSADGSVRIAGSGTGAFALLFALVRKDIQVYACEADPEKAAVALNCAVFPSNLHIVGEMAEAADFDLGMI